MSDKCKCGRPAVAIAYVINPDLDLGLINVTEPVKVCAVCVNKYKNDGCRIESIRE